MGDGARYALEIWRQAADKQLSDERHAREMERHAANKRLHDERHASEREMLLIALVLVTLAGTALAYLGYRIFYRPSQHLHFWDYNDRKLRWRSCEKFERAELPESSDLFGRIAQLVEDYGGRNCSEQQKVAVTGVELVRNWDLSALGTKVSGEEISTVTEKTTKVHWCSSRFGTSLECGARSHR